MTLIIKFFKISLFTLLSVVAIGVLYTTFEKEIDVAYAKVFWKLPTEIAGISIGDEKSDAFFKLGKYKSECHKNDDFCRWKIDEIGETNLYIQFTDDVSTLMIKESESAWQLNEIPFKDIETMKNILGEPLIYAESKDFLRRRYTYVLDIKSKKGVTFDFVSNNLTEYMIGNVRLRAQSGETGKYVIGGKIICPGEDCPFDSKGDLKLQFKDKDFTYFLKN